MCDRYWEVATEIPGPSKKGNAEQEKVDFYKSEKRGETYISSVDIFVVPTAKISFLPSAVMATTASAGTETSMRAPFEVNPGHMMLAPAMTNLMAPRSTCSLGNMLGSIIDYDVREHFVS